MMTSGGLSNVGNGCLMRFSNMRKYFCRLMARVPVTAPICRYRNCYCTSTVPVLVVVRCSTARQALVEVLVHYYLSCGSGEQIEVTSRSSSK